jgi:hypothetical protein
MKLLTRVVVDKKAGQASELARLQFYRFSRWVIARFSQGFADH